MTCSHEAHTVHSTHDNDRYNNKNDKWKAGTKIVEIVVQSDHGSLVILELGGGILPFYLRKKGKRRKRVLCSIFYGMSNSVSAEIALPSKMAAEQSISTTCLCS